MLHVLQISSLLLNKSMLLNIKPFSKLSESHLGRDNTRPGMERDKGALKKETQKIQCGQKLTKEQDWYFIVILKEKRLKKKRDEIFQQQSNIAKVRKRKLIQPSGCGLGRRPEGCKFHSKSLTDVRLPRSC